jgi:hypothetical protein
MDKINQCIDAHFGGSAAEGTELRSKLINFANDLLKDGDAKTGETGGESSDESSDEANSDSTEQGPGNDQSEVATSEAAETTGANAQ